ncbi:MAG: TIGR01458 family HAD-type hydrolase [Gammaproteobacteria bacterium]|nr:TIGR01458 family HAD-type hydrolase [Gammaproteobacteria bacterium]
MSLTFDALLLDLSGVLYDQGVMVPGARDCVIAAREKGLQLRFVTNTATRSHNQILQNLLAMGLMAHVNELYTAPRAARAYMEARDLHPLTLVHPAIADEFTHLQTTNPNCVLLGDAREALTYSALNQAFRLCQAGAPLIGIGLNRYFSSDKGLMLDAGAYITGLAWAAGVVPIIMGKPSTDFFQQVAASTGCPVQRCLMVGDDLNGDVIGALNSGMQACLVQTGKYRPTDAAQLPPEAQLLPSIKQLFDTL